MSASSSPAASVDDYIRAYGNTFRAIAQTLTSFFGIVAGFTYFFGILAAVSVWRSWPGMLSICSWTVEVVGHFFLVLFIILLLAASSMFSYATNLGGFPTYGHALYSAYLSLMVGILLPAVLLWGLSASVMAQRRIKLSG
jgi:hypothetical protein